MKAFLISFSVIIIFIVFLKIYTEPEPEKHYISGAYEALKFWTHSRAYPAKDISKEKFYQAYLHKKNVLKKHSSLADSSTWESMGPNNVGGRMISVAVNPHNSNTLYAGSASGGLWRTYNALGETVWHRVSTGFPTLGVMAIAISPEDSNTIYIGTGEVYGYHQSIGGSVIRSTRGSYGFGILKTTDAGRTWSLSLDWTNYLERGVQCIRINPQNPNSIYAATTEGIYKSTNAGKTWNNKLPVLMGEDIKIHPTDTTDILVSCGNLGSAGSGIYRSLDGGTSWDQVQGIPNFTGKTMLEMVHSDPDVVFASVADAFDQIGLYKTNDFGDSWTQVHSQDVSSYQGWFSHFVAVHPTSPDQVVHAGVRMYKSTNGGSSLNQIGGIHVDHHNYAHDPNNPGIIYVANDGGIYRSTDFGENYTNLEFGLQTAQLYNGLSNSRIDSALAIGGLQDNGTILYRGTKSWRTVFGGDGCWTAINQIDDNYIYGETQYNNIKKSMDRGISFNSATEGMDQGGAAFVAPFVISPSNPSILYSGRKSVFKTTNAADHWTDVSGILDGNSILSMAISRTNSDIVYAGTAPTNARAHIFRTLDGGASWTDVTKNLPNRYPMDLTVDPNNNQTVYAVFGGYGSGHVYKSTNSGNSWANITGNLPDVPTLAVEIDPAHSGYIYVGNDLGVYVSTDTGNTWSTFMNGLPEAVIATDLKVSITNRKIRVATHGNGVYQRDLLYKPDVYIDFNAELLPDEIYQNYGLTFTSTAANYGTQVQTDSFNIVARVLNNSGSEIYRSEKSVCCLAPKEFRQVSFDDLFSPANSGEHTFEFIKLGNDQQSRRDTVRQYFYVDPASTIGIATFSKQFSPYKDISGLRDSIRGDDSQMSFTLPFLFEYDEFIYDQMQISTNGWLEFGSGSEGTIRGLSSSAQIGPYGVSTNEMLATTERPTKTMTAWWDDLNIDDQGCLGYKIVGSSPARICIVQWKNVCAFYNTATTTRLNFQVKLYETADHIEFCYGPIDSGTFTGYGSGASIGLKDHQGGGYHYFDVYSGTTGPENNLTTDLSPLTNWPGPDSVFVIDTATGIPTFDQPVFPDKYSLKQNYPNPFNPNTTIEFTLPKRTNTTLKIFNLLGKEITTLVLEELPAGTHKCQWDASGYASGVYFYSLFVDSKTISTKKLVLIK